MCRMKAPSGATATSSLRFGCLEACKVVTLTLARQRMFGAQLEAEGDNQIRCYLSPAERRFQLPCATY